MAATLIVVAGDFSLLATPALTITLGNVGELKIQKLLNVVDLVHIIGLH